MCSSDLEIEAAEKNSDALTYDSLSPALKTAWEIWNRQFRGVEAARQLRSSLLELRFSSEDLELAEQHLQMLERFDRVLDERPEVTLPRNPSRQIATPDREISAPWVTIRSDRVIYRDTSEGPGRYLLWKELTPDSRLDLWLEAVPADDWAAFLALLLDFNGRTIEAGQIWQALADPSLQGLIGDLDGKNGKDER